MSLLPEDRDIIESMRISMDGIIKEAEEFRDNPYSDFSYDFRKALVEDLQRLRDRL